MRVFLALAALVQLALAQENLYRCDCAFFATSQIEDDYFGDQTAIPLYSTYTEYDPYTCTWPEGGFNPCKSFCQDWAADETDGGFNNLCRQTPETTERCYGGLYCEVLFNEGFTNVNEDSIRLFYRMTECPDSHREWTDATFELTSALCCTEGQYDSCYGGDCECYRAEGRRFCECGVFIPEQIEEAADGLTALPLAYVGNLTGDFDLGFCNNFGSAFFDPCRNECETSGEEYFTSYRLTDIPEDSTELTYGDLYCQAFKSRYVFFQGINSVLSVYQRAPECPTVGWLQIPDVEHPERICCDADGRHIYPCLEPAPENKTL